MHLVRWRSDGVFRLEAFLRAGGIEQLECLNEPHLFSVASVGFTEAVFELEAQVPEKCLCAHEENRKCGKRDGRSHVGGFGWIRSVVYMS